nr:uncharacterized protein LOC112763991 [Arachis hypogaea]
MVFDGVDDDVLLASLMDKRQQKCRRMYGLRKREKKGTTSLVAPRRADRSVFKGDRWLAILDFVNEIKRMRLICVVHGAHDKAEKLKLWYELSDLRTTCRAAMVIGGDFNDILKPKERLGCKVLSQSGCKFKAWVENMELVELELSGRKYTWYGGRRCSRIDRVFVDNECFVSVVKGEWCSMNGSDVLQKMKALRKPLRQWNKECSGSIESNLVKLEEEMKKVDEEKEKGGDDECLLARAMAIRNVIEVWYGRREDYWKQLSRLRFASQMDKNTKFYHSVAKTRRRSKVIEEIHINGNCYRGVGRVKNEVRQFYKELYKEEQILNILFNKSLVKSISAAEASSMELIPSKEEIKSAVWHCPPSRAAEPDGFNFKFIRRLWEVIGDEFCSSVRKFFVDCSLPKEANLTWVTLAHKEGGTNELKDSAYKHGGVLIQVYEIVHWLKRSRKAAWLIKLDFQKAYDRVRWDFVDLVLEGMGFGCIWRRWIWECLTTASMAILINRTTTKPFNIQWGLRQDDTILFCPCDFKTISNYRRVLLGFELLSGLRINYDKSVLIGLNVVDGETQKACEVLGCKEGYLSIKYLGVPLGANLKRIHM